MQIYTEVLRAHHRFCDPKSGIIEYSDKTTTHAMGYNKCGTVTILIQSV